LLYQDTTGRWHLLDWKTEWVAPDEQAAHAAGHLTQMAVYAQAARQLLPGLPVVSVCFLNPRVVLHIYPQPEWEAAFDAIAG